MEINSSHKWKTLPKDLYFPDQGHSDFNLLQEDHLRWLVDVIESHGIEFLVLDPLARMIGSLDVNKANDVAEINEILEALQVSGLTVLIVDHHRKPFGHRKNPHPLEISGSIQKWAGADFTIDLSTTRNERRLKLFCQNKDSDKTAHFLLDVSDKDSGLPKFTYAGDVKQLADERRAEGQANQARVLASLNGKKWHTCSEIAQELQMPQSTVRGHLNTLLRSGQVERRGKTKNAQWRRKDHPSE